MVVFLLFLLQEQGCRLWAIWASFHADVSEGYHHMTEFPKSLLEGRLNRRFVDICTP